MECNCACKYTFNTTTGAGSKVKILRGTSPSTPSPNNLHLWPFRKKDNEQYRNTIFLKNESSLSLIYQSQNTNNFLQSWYSTCEITRIDTFHIYSLGIKICIFSIAFITPPRFQTIVWCSLKQVFIALKQVSKTH